MPSIFRWPVVLLLLFLAATWIAACDKDGITEPDTPNRAPVATGAIPAQTIGENGTVTLDLSPWFNDPDGDMLTYSAQSSDAGLATASISGNTLTIRAAAGKTGQNPPETLSVGAPDISPYASPGRGDLEQEADARSHETLYKNQAATAEATGKTVLTIAAAEETATITVTARDPDGLSATQTFDATVETVETVEENQIVVAFQTDMHAAPEGSNVTLNLLANSTLESALTLHYALGADGDAASPDADASDYTDPAGGTLEIAAGSSSGVIEISINEDDDIEPTREVFTVTLREPGDGDGYKLGSPASAMVQIREGVCDRTPQVRDRIVQQTGRSECADIDDQALARIEGLHLQGNQAPAKQGNAASAYRNDITSLRERDFDGLVNLTVLSLAHNQLAALPPNIFADLDNLIDVNLTNNQIRALSAGLFSNLTQLEYLNLQSNQITELPEGIFTGLSRIKQLWLHRNPIGAIALNLEMRRTDSENLLAPGPAAINVHLAQGFPLTMEIPLSISGGTLSANSIVLEGGRTSSTEVIATRDANGQAGVQIALGEIADLRPAALTGIELRLPDPLTLFGATANSPPIVLAQLPAMRFRAGDAPESLKASRYFRDPDGGALTFSATVADPNVASVDIAGDLVTVRPQAGGSTKIAVTATDTDNLSVESVLLVSVREDRLGSFHIELIYLNEEARVLEPVFQSAANRWMAVLADTELPDVPFREELWRDCPGAPTDHQNSIDDLAIAISVRDFFGFGGGLASAGVCSVREGSRLPVTGTLTVDRADIPRLRDMGLLEQVILHEIGHNLGIGATWDQFDLLRNVATSFTERRTDTHFAGPLAIKAFDAAGGTNYPLEPKVPVDDNGGHWKLEALYPELMIGVTYPDERQPLSAITIQALADLGYTVDINQAEAYALPGVVVAKRGAAQAISYGDDVLKGPVRVVDRNGRTVRIIPAKE